MIQRKQSLFLLLGALLCLATWFYPVATYYRNGAGFEFYTYGLFTAAGVELTDIGMKIPFSIVISVLGAALLVTIFLYSNRPRQQRFVRGTYLLMLGVITFQFITDNSMHGYLAKLGEVDRTYGPSFFLPILALVFSFLAERAIKGDEALVRSADRLR